MARRLPVPVIVGASGWHSTVASSSCGEVPFEVPCRSHCRHPCFGLAILPVRDPVEDVVLRKAPGRGTLCLPCVCRSP